jgi:hypothetical protein
MASARGEFALFEQPPAVRHYERFGSRKVQGEFGSNVPDYEGSVEGLSLSLSIGRGQGGHSDEAGKRTPAEAPRRARDEYRVSASQRPSLPACEHS